jgi:hypothetical protein
MRRSETYSAPSTGCIARSREPGRSHQTCHDELADSLVLGRFDRRCPARRSDRRLLLSPILRGRRLVMTRPLRTADRAQHAHRHSRRASIPGGLRGLRALT